MPSLDNAAHDYGDVSLDDERLVVVHLLLYGPSLNAPTVDDARRWAEHFGLDERPGHVVLVGDKRMQSPATYAMVPGLQLIDRDFRLRFDAAGNGAPHDMWTDLWPAVGSFLDER